MVLSKEEKAVLSRRKYIHYIYTADHRVHVEKFPIVYLNDTCLYYKQAGSKELTKLDMFYVHPTLEQKIKDRIERMVVETYGEFKTYVFELTGDDLQYLIDLEERLEELKKLVEIRKIDNAVEKAKLQLERAQAAYENAVARKEAAKRDLP